MAASRVNDIPEAPVKDRDEPQRLHREVRASRILLKQAQHDMRATWAPG